MGYSGRYHLASLVAVFVALAIGILIGIGLAGDVVRSASEEIKQSLRSDLDDAEAEIAELDERLARELEFESLAYPALVNGRLGGRRVAVVSLGEPDEELVDEVRAALGPAGAVLTSLTVIALPPDVEALLETAGPRFADPDPLTSLERIGEIAGAQIVHGGGDPLDRLRPVLYSRASGQAGAVDRVVIARSAPEDDLDELQAGQTAALERGLIAGLDSAAENVVAVERTSIEPSLLGPLTDAGIPTVDHVDLVAGRVALVFTMLGAEGDYGIKGASDEYLPALIDSTSGPEAP